MKKILTFFISAILAAACGACATKSEWQDGEGGSLEDVAQEEIVRCDRMWVTIMDEWRKNGGGFKSSLQETRRHIENDKSSKFSRYVRATWVAQDSSEEYSGMKRWPLTNEDRYLVSEAFSRANSGILPKGCSTIMLDAVLWKELHLSRPNGGIYIDFGVSKILKFSDAPDSFAWDSPNAQSWTEFWLLRRASESGN